METTNNLYFHPYLLYFMTIWFYITEIMSEYKSVWMDMIINRWQK